MQTFLRVFVWVPLALVVTGCFLSDDDDPVAVAPLATGFQTVESSAVEREYYIRLPSDYQPADGVQAAAVGDAKPLIMAFHGYTGSYLNWVGENRFYDLIDVVGDGAIFVALNGLPDANGDRGWGGQDDLDFFVDLLAEFDLRGLNYDPTRIFVVGHSNGAGFANELGCAYGDVIRAIATAAGGLISTECVGSLGVLQMHGSNDPLTNGLIAAATKQYWTLYNGWDPDASQPSPLGPCVDFAFPDKPDNVPYPVLYCEHTQGHDWPDFGSVTAWAFMNSLPEVEPTVEAPPGGGAAVATPPSDTTLFVQLQLPVDSPLPLRAAFTLRPVSWIDNPTCSAPDVTLNFPYPVSGVLVPGEVSDQLAVPVTYFSFTGQPTFPSDWTLSVTVYVEGGSDQVIPTPGVDYETKTPITLVSRETELVVPEVLQFQPVEDLCGFGN